MTCKRPRRRYGGVGAGADRSVTGKFSGNILKIILFFLNSGTATNFQFFQLSGKAATGLEQPGAGRRVATFFRTHWKQRVFLTARANGGSPLGPAIIFRFSGRTPRRLLPGQRATTVCAHRGFRASWASGATGRPEGASDDRGKGARRSWRLGLGGRGACLLVVFWIFSLLDCALLGSGWAIGHFCRRGSVGRRCA